MTDAGFSYGKRERLRKRREYLEVYAKGEKVRTKYFFLYRLRNGLDRNRLGLTVSRKIGKTILRNKLKRQLREIYRKHCKGVVPTYDLVVNATRAATSAPYRDLEKEFTRAADCHVRQ